MKDADKRELLSCSALMENLLPAELVMISDLFHHRDFRAGDIIFREGDVGESLFVVASGEVEVLGHGASGEMYRVDLLGPSQFFGELSIIDKEYRSATVRATKTTTILELSSENLHTFAKNFRNGFTWVVVNIARVLAARLRECNRMLAKKM